MQCNANDNFMFSPSTHFQCLISSIQPVICWCTVKMIVLTYLYVFLSDSQYQWESSQVKSIDGCICIWNYVFGIWDDVFGISLITYFEITRGGCRPHRRQQSSQVKSSQYLYFVLCTCQVHNTKYKSWLSDIVNLVFGTMYVFGLWYFTLSLIWDYPGWVPPTSAAAVKPGKAAQTQISPGFVSSSL